MKKRNLFTRFALLFLFWSNGLLSLNPLLAQGLDFSQNDQLSKIAEPVGTAGWVSFKPNLPVSEVFTAHRSAFMLGQTDEMKLLKEESDQLGWKHYRYQQLHEGLVVEGAQFMIHTKDGKAIKGNGAIVTGLARNNQPRISTEQVIEIAKSQLPAKDYKWEDLKAENNLKELRKDPSASYYPAPELLYALKNTAGKMEADNYFKCYRVIVHSKDPHQGKELWINAETGAIEKSIALHRDCTLGTGRTYYNNDQRFNTYPIPNNSYELYDDCRGSGIITRRYSPSLPHLFIIDADNSWYTTSQKSGVSAHWIMQKSYDYYLNEHGRNSYDNAGGTINVVVENPGDGGAFWNGFNNSVNFNAVSSGNPNVIGPSTSLDVGGHELTHGVIQNAANLAYEFESGALNESFADIFGTMIEFSRSESPNYVIGEDYWTLGDGYIRSMAQPKSNSSCVASSNPCPLENTCGTNILSFAQPDTYLGEYWVPSSAPFCDHGGVHINSGVQNHWFYLLAEGSGATDEVNDNGDLFSLTGIGNTKAAQIAYRNLTVYLTSNSGFAEARAGSIQAATDLFGPCSDERAQTIAAWDAVGVYGPPPSAVLPIVSIDGPSEINCEGSFTACPASPNTTYTWTFSDPCGVINGSGPAIGLWNNCNANISGYLCVTATNILGSDQDCMTVSMAGCDRGFGLSAEANPALLTDQFIVSPNPAQNQLQISLPSKSTATLADIYDLSGRKLTSYNILNEDQFYLDVSDLATGMYLLKVSTSGQNFTEKIVIRK